MTHDHFREKLNVHSGENAAGARFCLKIGPWVEFECVD